MDAPPKPRSLVWISSSPSKMIPEHLITWCTLAGLSHPPTARSGRSTVMYRVPFGKHTRIPPLNMILWPRKQDTQSSSTNLVGWVLRADKGRLLPHLDNERPFRQTAGLYPKQRRRCSSVLVFFCTCSVCQHAVVTCARTVRERVDLLLRWKETANYQPRYILRPATARAKARKTHAHVIMTKSNTSLTPG